MNGTDFSNENPLIPMGALTVRHTSIGGLFGVCWDGTDALSRYRQAKLAPHPEPILPLEIEL